MKILYFSVHTALEYDEIRMFHALGHEVFPLGVHFGFEMKNPFRTLVEFSDYEKSLLPIFYQTGCHYANNEPSDTVVLTEAFVSLFDVIIVMHDVKLITRLWETLKAKPVIWRTIGQNIDALEKVAAPLKMQGMHIVRYSDYERKSPEYCGETAVIRFGKNPEDYPLWTGEEKSVLTFTNWFEQRYPIEYDRFLNTVNGMFTRLGGMGNEGRPHSIGVVEPNVQETLYRQSGVYLYCSGSNVPYTLSFMEALMTGIPMVIMNYHPIDPYYEVPALVEHCKSAIIAENSSEANHWLHSILDDHALAERISLNARSRAISMFGYDTISIKWKDLLNTVVNI